MLHMNKELTAQCSQCKRSVPCRKILPMVVILTALALHFFSPNRPRDN